VFSFKIHPKDYYGLIKLNVITPDSIDHNLILQLIDKNDKLVSEKYIFSSGDIIFENLHPAEYRFRMIYDANNNKKWDTGNYLSNIQPEKIVYFPEKINVRSNWDLDFEWNLQVKEKITEEKSEDSSTEEAVEDEE
jgi:hypothetical protein